MELARILRSLVGKSIYHVNISKEFADEIRNTKLEEGECITTLDVTALFTTIPVALEFIKVRLEHGIEHDMESFEHKAINTALNPQGTGGGMLMTHLYFNNSHTRRSFSNTSTQWILPSSLLWKKLDPMVTFHFWTY